MSKQIIDLGVYIGRFSPLHVGHCTVIDRMQKNYDYGLIIVGSSFQAPTIKNPWSFDERKQMIQGYLKSLNEKDKIEIVPAVDVPYNDTQWVANINSAVENRIAEITRRGSTFSDFNKVYEIKVTLVGADRDDSTYYLKYFPNFKKDLVAADNKISPVLSATIVRNIYFGGVFDGKPITEAMSGLLLRSFLPQSTNQVLNAFSKLEKYEQLKREFEFIKGYKSAWSVAPYPPTFVTVDAVVVQAGHILMIERKAEPGKGLYALPGGFVNQDERLLDAAIRELREETKLKVPVPVLKGSMIRKEVFDLPERSLRGRTITIAFLFKLAEIGELPAIKGGDDAAKAMWVPLSEIYKMREELFEDHYALIETMLGGAL